MTTSPFYFQTSLVGGTLQVQVWLVAGTDADTADLHVTYDSTLGSYSSFTPAAGWFPEVNGSTPGIVLASEIDLSPGNNPVAATADGLLGTFSFTLAPDAQSFTLSLTSGTDLYNPGGNQISVQLPPELIVNFPICFCPGSLIQTPDGQVPVENVKAGDWVVTWRGEKRQIVWIGTGQVLATRGRRNAATPVIVRKGALADNIPNRDLRVTKGHAFLLDDVLIPVEFLVNYRSVLWDDHAQEVALYHIELESHDVLVANGAPTESYRDDGNRWLFRNVNLGWGLPAQKPCAPVRTGGPVVDAVWRRILDRAGPRTLSPLTNDPDLHLFVDGKTLAPTCRHGANYIFNLTEPPRALRIISRDAVPAELGLVRDFRSLGVALRYVTIRDGTRTWTIDASDAALTDGFYSFEDSNGIRWTNGDAGLPTCLFDGVGGPLEVIIQLGGETQYRIDAESRQVA